MQMPHFLKPDEFSDRFLTMALLVVAFSCIYIAWQHRPWLKALAFGYMIIP